ncbi:acyltransferase family protein [soil metagenome]
MSTLTPTAPAAPTQRVRIAHLPALDGLRGAAVAAVVAFHLGLTTGGYLGVDLFFTLSGFLITSLLVAEWRARGRIDLKVFWVRRARRLLPAMLLVLVAVAWATQKWASNTTFDQVHHDGLATLAYVANWRSVAAGTDYWDLFARPSPLEHTWSLAIEEQFYVVWPLISVGLLLWWGRRRRRAAAGDDREPGPLSDTEVRTGLNRYLAVTLGLAALSAASALWRYRGAGDANRVYFGTDTRAAAILFGAAFAIATARFGTVTGRRARVALEVAAIAVMIPLGWAWLHLPGTDARLYHGGLLLCGLATTVVLAAASHPRPGPVAQVLSFAPLRWLGLISYGLYLWHWPVIIFFTPGRTGWYDGGLLAARLGISLSLAIVSYWVLERPIRHGLGRGWPIRLATPVAIVAVVAVLGWAAQGAVAPIGVGERVRGKLTVADDAIPPVTDGRPRLLVVGDSGAWGINKPMNVVAPVRGIDEVNRGTPACGILPGDGRTRRQNGETISDPDGCGDWPVRWASYVADVQPDVALIFTVAPGGSSRWVEGQWRKDCDPTYDRASQAEYEKAIRLLGSDGARVGITTLGYLESESDADGRFPELDCRNDSIRRAAKATGATVIDLARYTCGDKGRCRQTIETLSGEEVELRADGLHYTGPGGVVVARYTLDRLGLRKTSS